MKWAILAKDIESKITFKIKAKAKNKLAWKRPTFGCTLIKAVEVKLFGFFWKIFNLIWILKYDFFVTYFIYLFDLYNFYNHNLCICNICTSCDVKKIQGFYYVCYWYMYIKILLGSYDWGEVKFTSWFTF